MKQIFRKLHLWLSIPFGLIISIICLSGAALVFETELMESCYSERYYVKQVGEEALTIKELLVKVQETLPDSVSTTSVSISSNPQRAYQIGLSQPRRASVYIDQYTGEIKGMQKRTAFFSFMLRMHRWLLDGMKPGGGMSLGKTIVGISTLLFVFIIISGIIIRIPHTYKVLKNRLKISVNKGWKRFWYDLHVAGGIWTAVILLALALTGLTWSFSWYRTGFYKVFGAEVPQNPQQVERNKEKEEGRKEQEERRRGGRGQRDGQAGRVNYSNWQLVYEQLRETNIDYKQISISDASASVSFNGWGNQRAADRYTFNPRNGEIEEVNLYKDQEKAGKLRGWIYSVHVGSWGGLLTKIITFIAALIGGILPLTGYYFWLRKLRNKKKKRKMQ